MIRSADRPIPELARMVAVGQFPPENVFKFSVQAALDIMQTRERVDLMTWSRPPITKRTWLVLSETSWTKTVPYSVPTENPNQNVELEAYFTRRQSKILGFKTGETVEIGFTGKPEHLAISANHDSSENAGWIQKDEQGKARKLRRATMEDARLYKELAISGVVAP